jgi:myosin heavy subunit
MIVPGIHCLAMHPEHAWVPAVIEDFDGKTAIVNVLKPKKEQLSKVKQEDLFVCDEKAMEEDVNDLLNLSVLHDGTLLNCLRHRYFKDIVYTNIGAIVVALNPFNFKIPWYMDNKMPDYLAEGETIQNNLPHSWAVAHTTYYEMRSEGGNQCILVSGESGAGKTEASKIVMRYLGAVSSLRGNDEEKKAAHEVGLRMMESNPILEAFGNAKTVRNDNSSRFGKLMKIKFDRNGFLTGADITKYLLEKSRIISAAQDERVYHSFYLILKGRDRETYGLLDMKHYKSVMSGKAPDIPDVDDAQDYLNVNQAMTICGVTNEQRNSVWKCLAGILSLLDAEFKDRDADSAEIAPDTTHFVSSGAQCFGISEKTLRSEFLTTTLTVNGQQIVTTLNKVKAIDARDSLCKAVYDNLFSWLVQTINKTIDTENVDSWIALLDIFGFEDFKTNSFEQLCINLTNETLQGHYNSYIFTKDMEECRQEGIDVTNIEFPDNRPCIDMISGKEGILAILDDVCRLGKSTDTTFHDKVCERYDKKCDFFERPKIAKTPCFRIVHYAGTVTYDVENFLDKNRDTLKDAFKTLMRSSTDDLVKVLLPAPSLDAVKFTVGGFFRNQLKELMDLINSTNPHWIRCIKPHPAKKPLHFDGKMTLTQLRSSGVLGTVQIRKAGYPVRIKIADFAKKYKVVARGVDGVDFNNPVAVSTAILKAANFSMKMAQMGKTRAFLKSEAYQHLELLKKAKLQSFAQTAVCGALIGLARRRTSAFLKNRYIETVQAFLHTRASQHLFRKIDFEARKDVIVAQVKLLLKLQREEELLREEELKSEQQLRARLMVQQIEDVAALEAKWWQEKPIRDAKQQTTLQLSEEKDRSALLAEEQASLQELLALLEEDEAESMKRQEEREEFERQEELRRIKEEEERQRVEELRRLEEERIAALHRKEEQRRIALYFWNIKKREMQELERRKATEEAHKLRFVTDAVTSVEISRELMKEEEHLQRREKANYPPPQFRVAGKAAQLPSTYHVLKSPMRQGAFSEPHGSPPPDRDRSSFSSSPSIGIGGLNPTWVNPAREKARMQQERIVPDQCSSLQMVQKMRKLQQIKDHIVLKTPHMNIDDVRNPLNPNSPDWEPPSTDVIVLPDGTQIKLSEVDVPLFDENGSVKKAKPRSRMRTL